MGIRVKTMMGRTGSGSNGLLPGGDDGLPDPGGLSESKRRRKVRVHWRYQQWATSWRGLSSSSCCHHSAEEEDEDEEGGDEEDTGGAWEPLLRANEAQGRRGRSPP